MEKKRKIEIAVLVGVIVLAVVILWIRGCVNTKAASETALMNELRAVRTAVTLYMKTNRVYPPDLNVLTSEKLGIGGGDRTYLSGILADEEGYPVDAFGNRFNYDPGVGRVWAAGDKYKNW